MAWEFHEKKEELGIKEIRLEKPVKITGKIIEVDLILTDLEGKYIPIELKYKTKDDSFNVNDEDFELKKHGAIDLGCYDFMKDIARIEEFKKSYSDKFKIGFAIFLTNDSLYIRSKEGNASCYEQFKINEGRKITSGQTFDWIGNKMPWQKSRGQLTFQGNYLFNWNTYSKGFNYLLININ